MKSRWNRVHFKCSPFDASNVSPYFKRFPPKVLHIHVERNFVFYILATRKTNIIVNWFSQFGLMNEILKLNWGSFKIGEISVSTINQEIVAVAYTIT